jgi:hypothetical protein
MYASLKERLEANSKIGRKVIRGVKCKLWNGAKNNRGYGKLSRRDGERVYSVSVHKVAFVEVHGKKLPKGHDVSHLCDIRNCWEKKHLVAEKHRDNCKRVFA